jgi:phytoene dehydrogenase-like protein
MMKSQFDAIVVGSGPNGLAAAVAIAQAKRSVLVYEAGETIGGGTRTMELTRPGFLHDVCSAVHPMALASPFWRNLPLASHGLEWIQPTIPLAHPLDHGRAAVLEQSLEGTAQTLGRDGPGYRKLFGPILPHATGLFEDLLGPFRIPRRPFAALQFGWRAIRSCEGLAAYYFESDAARALIAGIGAHSVLPLDQSPSAAVTVMLGLAGHAVGWPVPKGGSQQIASALAAYLKSLGGVIETGRRIASLAELPPAKAIVFDLSPRQIVAIAGRELPSRYRRQLEGYRYGPGVFKIDWALSEPIPWQAAACRKAGTIHVGGTLEEVARSEKAVWQNQTPEKPFVLLTQPSLFDNTRAPAGQHTAWGYCHVPHGSAEDRTEAIEQQIERFAPGFRDVIQARHTMGPAAFEKYNENYIGGDITGGVADWWQLFTRPVVRLNPYATPNPRLFICSASTPPGGGVHGMCGYYAAQTVLRSLKRNRLNGA